jgi:DNA-binding response OmpR family regulator
MRILLVGKDDDQAHSIVRVLTESRTPVFEVERAANAWDAQGRAAQGPYDALVVDDSLSDADGETLLQRLRASGVHAPALLLTSTGWDQMAPMTPQARGDSYLPRSEGSNGYTLIRAIVSMLERQRLKGELAAAHAEAVRSAAALAALKHDLATPLGVIAGMAQVLLDDDYGFNEDGRACLEDMLQAATTASEHVKRAGNEPPDTNTTRTAYATDFTAHPGPSTDTRMVLIADDDAATRRLVSLALASDRYTVLQAADGKEAWRLIRDHHPAVAILDWQMPVYSGLELADVIKSDPQVWGMTVIMLTGRTGAADREAGAQARADLYLTKPFSPHELVAAVEQALGIS